ncbi:het domain-containing protein [Colletotrichum asianum]|uniref:Het domain-containing protein n=1 Tax=Colletotrichum asianum TaxID=702518 RepID=A0A8H3ZS82_9PEZI|nr:het domain-containing protein [Colletotrichum asianum]
MDSPRTGTASEFKLAPGLRYEHSAEEDAVIHLHQLCSPCAKFTTTSPLLRTLARRGRIRILASEIAHVGTPFELKAGYSSGCHLCALLWDRVAAHLLDPARSARSMDYSTPVAVILETRDDEKEYAIEVQKGTDWKRKAWWAVAPLPYLSDKGYIKLKTTALGSEIASYLYIHRRASPDLNIDSLRHNSVSLSSRNNVNFEVIKKWQIGCTEHHSACRKFPSVVSPTNQAPSRLLNVSGENVRLECDVGATTPGLEYTTLSHMWGPDPSLCPQLLVSTIDSFMLSISMHDLPKKYVDAIEITRALGFQYIWIDSLCIIQDSKEDWLREAVKMAAVYYHRRNAMGFPDSRLSRRNLTKETDRGIAFAGIARATQAKANVTYLAGLWKEFLEYDLLWSVSPVPVNVIDYEQVRKESESAPSWSWFSVPTYKTALGNDILDFPFRTTMQTYRHFSIYNAKTVSYYHPDGLANIDSLLYKFAGMTLTIRAKRIPCTLEWRDAPKLLYVLPLGDYKWALGMRNVWLKSSQQWIRSKCLKYAHDDPLLKEEDQLPQDACMILTVEQAFYTDKSATQHAYSLERQQKGDIPDSWNPTYQYAGIVVVPVGSTDAQVLVRWRRIGVFIFSDDIEEEGFTTPFDEYGATEEDLVLI